MAKKRKRKLISGEEAAEGKTQHTSACSDCPFARDALKGWLGNMTVEDWIQVAHGESTVECHAIKNTDCAGLAIYRANVSKLPRDLDAFRLPADRETVFASPMQFKEHHQLKRKD